MKQCKIFLSEYRSVEKMLKNKEHDFCLDLKTRTDFIRIKARTIKEATEIFKKHLSDEELEKYYNWCFYFLKDDGEIESCRCCSIVNKMDTIC